MFVIVSVSIVIIVGVMFMVKKVVLAVLPEAVCRVVVIVSVFRGEVGKVRAGRVSRGVGRVAREGGVGRENGGMQGKKKGDRRGGAEREVSRERRESGGGRERERSERGSRWDERGGRDDREGGGGSGRVGKGNRVAVVRGSGRGG